MSTPLRVGGTISGFTCTRIAPLPDLRAEARLFLHDASGARLLHVAAPEDNENCLAITFPTPPSDDTGVPHILEHSVLGGSERFPVREPFFEMIKMSLATFINAFTAQDYTSYPVCSPVPKDFFNLAEVYLDAVFHPLITPETFRREAHHFAFEKPGDTSSPLTLKGIVYSEMQGYAASPENRLYFLAHRLLYPGHPLGRDSGGDPDHIPELTYEAFRDFHATRYHPSNALIFSYGDIPTGDLAAFLDRLLAGFTADSSAAAPAPAAPEAWSAPRSAEAFYEPGPDDPGEEMDYLTLHWAIGDAIDADAHADWELIETLLLGHDGAPLRKALVDSGLGADTCLTGFCSHGWMKEFHVGLKGSRAGRFADFESLVRRVLSDWASRPPAAAEAEAAFQQLAYASREIGRKLPLATLNSVNSAWPYGRDPLTLLFPRARLDACRARWQADPLHFGRLVREKLLDNPHLLRLTLRPDRDLAARKAAALAAKLEARRAAMSDDERGRVDRAAAELDALNGRPNPPEQLALLPQLAIADLPDRPKSIPTVPGDVRGVPLLRNEVFANGVNYLALHLDLAGLPPDLRSSLGWFAIAWNRMGAAGQDFATLAARRAACTGGLSLAVSSSLRSNGDFLPGAVVTLRTLDESASGALALLGDLLFGVDARDAGRLRDLLDQTTAACRDSLAEEGLALARATAARHVSPVSAFAYELGFNPDTLRLLEAAAADFDATAAKVAADVERLRAFLLDPRRWAASFTGSDSVFSALQAALGGWIAAAPAPSAPLPPPAPLPPAFPPERPREGVAVSGTVAHCAFAMPAPAFGDPRFPLLDVGMNLVSNQYCLPEIRFKGNAYGAGATYAAPAGTALLYSGWDPRIAETLAVFDGARDYVATAPWTRDDIHRAIIACSAGAVSPVRPFEATSVALMRYLGGIDETLRQEIFAARRSATSESVREAMLSLFDEGLPHSAVAVVASRERLAAAGLASREPPRRLIAG
ncbi:MAG: insulinase family protein [Kiritimatiellia bacterium]|jgi:Zn-dependent M16 (insulinase) family peptidase